MFNPYPIYAHEMFGTSAPPPPSRQQQHPNAIIGAHGLEMVGAASYYGASELDRLLAMSGETEMVYGQDPYANAYAGLDTAYGGLEMVGVDPRTVRRRPATMAQPGTAPMPPDARQVQVSTSVGDHVRRQGLGLSTPTTVAPATQGVASAQPQIPFRPEKLVVPSDINGSFDILDVKVGKDSQFVAPGLVPARVFDEKAVDHILSFHAAAISQVISVSVINNAGVALTFKCYMTGTSVE